MVYSDETTLCFKGIKERNARAFYLYLFNVRTEMKIYKYNIQFIELKLIQLTQI